LRAMRGAGAHGYALGRGAGVTGRAQHGGVHAQAPFHALVKPCGARCNLACSYCFYLGKRDVVGDAPARMSDGVLEAFTREYVEAQPTGTREIEFAWQGGEPTLAGIAFFRRALELQRRHARPGMAIRNALQTNGTLIDEEWARFLAEERFLVGVSLDGPAEVHDRMRIDPAGRATHARALRGLRLLLRRGVDVNVLAVIQRDNAARPERVYDFLVGTGVRHLQFIPLVEGDGERAAEPEAYGEFLARVLERWLARRHVGEVFVRDFDALLAGVLDVPGSTCVAAPECGRCLVVERTGDVFACDHFVDAEHRLGRIGEAPLAAMVDSPAQLRFGRDKRASLPAECRACEHLRWCFGGCPKDRLDALPGFAARNRLCAGYRRFFERALPAVRAMADRLRAGRPASEWDRGSAAQAVAAAGRNERCACGSGLKAKRCCRR
jgi:uncharacterized protein